MPKAFSPRKRNRFSLPRFSRPLKRIISGTPPLVSRGNKPLEFTFEQELTALRILTPLSAKFGSRIQKIMRAQKPNRKLLLLNEIINFCF